MPCMHNSNKLKFDKDTYCLRLWTIIDILAYFMKNTIIHYSNQNPPRICKVSMSVSSVLSTCTEDSSNEINGRL